MIAQNAPWVLPQLGYFRFFYIYRNCLVTTWINRSNSACMVGTARSVFVSTHLIGNLLSTPNNSETRCFVHNCGICVISDIISLIGTLLPLAQAHWRSCQRSYPQRKRSPHR